MSSQIDSPTLTQGLPKPAMIRACPGLVEGSKGQKVQARGK